MPPDHQLLDVARRAEADVGVRFDVAAARPLSGGTTNAIWRAPSNQGDLVIKLYTTPSDANSLFPNNADDEALVLRFLESEESPVAPSVVAVSEVEPKFIIYRFLEGRRWAGQLAESADLLGRIHGTDVAVEPAGLPQRRVELGAAAALARGDQLVSSVRDDSARERVLAARPPAGSPSTDNLTPTLIHGDPTPANFVSTDEGLRLIDWQCPALGDPAHDLAVFLSPLMMFLHGDGPLTPEETNEFLDAYPDQRTVKRYLTDRPSWHWQLAAYGAFRSLQLENTNPHLGRLYRQGIEHEVDLLNI